MFYSSHVGYIDLYYNAIKYLFFFLLFFMFFFVFFFFFFFFFFFIFFFLGKQCNMLKKPIGLGPLGPKTDPKSATEPTGTAEKETGDGVTRSTRLLHP